MKTILHVGLHKTASTFLQEKIWPQIEGFTYLDAGLTNHHHSFNRLKYADETLYDEETVARELRAFAKGPLLISDESLSGRPTTFSFINRTLIARRLRKLYPDAVPLIFLRDPTHRAVSLYRSYIHLGHGTLPASKYLWRSARGLTLAEYRSNPREFDMEKMWFNPNLDCVTLESLANAPVVRLYRELFPCTEFFLYESLRIDPETVRGRLEQIFGQPIRNWPAETVNASPSWANLEQERLVNRIRKVVRSGRLARGIGGILAPLCRGVGSAQRAVKPAEFAPWFQSDNSELRSLLPSFDWSRYGDFYHV